MAKGTGRFVLCVSNGTYKASLEPRKVYRVLPDRAAEAKSLLRVVDESGEDYLFPASHFVSQLMHSVAPTYRKTGRMEEREVIEFVLAGDDSNLAVLREQARSASVAHREDSGAGFFWHFDVPATAARLTGLPSIRIGDAGCTVNGNDCGLILFVNDGLLDFLECHVWGAGEVKVPLTIQDLYYLADGRKSMTRDLKALRGSLNSRGHG